MAISLFSRKIDDFIERKVASLRAHLPDKKRFDLLVHTDRYFEILDGLIEPPLLGT
jgi:hypothetical protein